MRPALCQLSYLTVLVAGAGIEPARQAYETCVDASNLPAQAMMHGQTAQDLNLRPSAYQADALPG